MVKSSLAAISDADIVILIIDGSENVIVDQELKLAFYAFEQKHKSLIILINKQDLETEISTAKILKEVLIIINILLIKFL